MRLRRWGVEMYHPKTVVPGGTILCGERFWTHAGARAGAEARKRRFPEDSGYECRPVLVAERFKAWRQRYRDTYKEKSGFFR